MSQLCYYRLQIIFELSALFDPVFVKIAIEIVIIPNLMGLTGVTVILPGQYDPVNLYLNPTTQSTPSNSYLSQIIFRLLIPPPLSIPIVYLNSHLDSFCSWLYVVYIFSLPLLFYIFSPNKSRNSLFLTFSCPN
jgi:hypothetical protein